MRKIRLVIGGVFLTGMAFISGARWMHRLHELATDQCMEKRIETRKNPNGKTVIVEDSRVRHYAGYIPKERMAQNNV